MLIAIGAKLIGAYRGLQVAKRAVMVVTVPRGMTLMKMVVSDRILDWWLFHLLAAIGAKLIITAPTHAG